MDPIVETKIKQESDGQRFPTKIDALSRKADPLQSLNRLQLLR